MARWYGLAGRLGRGARAAWRATIHWPIALARWIRGNPSRAVALVWLGGMATFVVVDGRRAYRQYRRDAAVRVAEARPEAADQPPEAIESQRAGGAGDVVVMTKGGIAGWVARNKDKKADPDTLKWLREEEAADGRAAYAVWAEGDSTIASWLERGKAMHRGSEQATGDRQQATGNRQQAMAEATERHREP